MDRAQTLDAVDVLDAFVDQAVTLAMQPTIIFFGNTWHTHNAPHFRLVRRGSTDSLNQTGQQVVRRNLNIQPTITIRPGCSPFGPNLRAFVIYLRFVHAISFERLMRLMSDLFGLAISEGALVAMLADSRPAFARQSPRPFARRQRAAVG